MKQLLFIKLPEYIHLVQDERREDGWAGRQADMEAGRQAGRQVGRQAGRGMQVGGKV